jgi:pimeloyl-ACP methyl ester carboxylesterase
VTRPVDVPIKGGGHLISLTHPGEINSRMAEWLGGREKTGPGIML